MLLHTTGIPDVDAIMRDLVIVLAERFHDRLRGIYLVGSYAVGCPVWTSDIDMVAIFKGELQPPEREQVRQLVEQYRSTCRYAIEVTPDGEERLAHVGASRFQHTSLLLYGDDIRAAIPLKPLDAYVRDEMHLAYRILTRPRGNPASLRFPLAYPDPAGEFYGYDRRLLPLPDGTVRFSTKDLVLTIVCAATALLGLERGRMVRHKSELAAMYRRWIGDEWTTTIESIVAVCRDRWAYLIPEHPEERQELRDLCRHALAFENHFLGRYRAYLLADLGHPDPAIQRFTVKRLGQLIYPDPELLDALRAAGRSANSELRQALADTLRVYRRVRTPSV